MAEAADSGTSFGQNSVLDGFYGLNFIRQLGLMLLLALSIGGGVGIALWSQGEDYRPLYSSLDKMDPAAVLNILDSNQINY